MKSKEIKGFGGALDSNKRYGVSGLLENMTKEFNRVREIIKGHNDSVSKDFTTELLIVGKEFHVTELEIFKILYLDKKPKMIEELLTGENQDAKIFKSYADFIYYIINKEFENLKNKPEATKRDLIFTREPTAAQLGLEFGISKHNLLERITLIKNHLDNKITLEDLVEILESEEDVLDIAKEMYSDYRTKCIIYLLHLYENNNFVKEDFDGQIMLDKEFYNWVVDNYLKNPSCLDRWIEESCPR